MTSEEFLDALEVRLNQAKHENWKVTLTGEEWNRLTLTMHGQVRPASKRRRYVAKVRRMINTAREAVANRVASKLARTALRREGDSYPRASYLEKVGRFHEAYAMEARLEDPFPF